MKCPLSCTFFVVILSSLPLSAALAVVAPLDSLGLLSHQPGAAPLLPASPGQGQPGLLLTVAAPLSPQGQQRLQEPANSLAASAPVHLQEAVRLAAAQGAAYERQHFNLQQAQTQLHTAQARLRTAEYGRHQAWLASAGLAAALLLALGLGWWASRQQRRRAERATQLRLRLAADLHQEVDTLLARVSHQAEQLSQQQTSPSPALTHLLGTSRAAAHTMRDVVWSIDAQADTVGALLERMRDHLDQTADATGLLTELHADGLRPTLHMRPELRQHLYLSFKEAVANTVRHAARPTKVVVTLTHYAVANALMLTVEDDGQPSLAQRRGGQGLDAMHQRAQALRGALETGPQPQGGFRVWLQVPF